jgi:hypothetical protein
VITRVLPAADVAIYAGILESIGEGRIEEDVVQPQPSITLPSSSHVVPKGIHRLGRMERPDRVHPALRENSVICRAALRVHAAPAPRCSGSDAANHWNVTAHAWTVPTHRPPARFVKNRWRVPMLTSARLGRRMSTSSARFELGVRMPGGNNFLIYLGQAEDGGKSDRHGRPT